MASLDVPDRGEPDPAGPDVVWAQSARIAFRFLYLVVAVIAVGWALSNVREVPPDSRVVVLRFGSAVRQQGAGLLIAWPRPIEQVVTLPSADRQIEFPILRFDETGTAYPTSRPTARILGLSAPSGTDTIPGFDMSANQRLNAGFLLTGDSSVVHLQATLFYQISDPMTYLVAADHVPPALERLFIASAISVCAGRDLDTILVARPESPLNAGDAARSSREQLRADLMNAVNRRLGDLTQQGAGLGITVSRVDLVPAIPSGAKSEFDHVLVASQVAEQEIAEARTAAEVAAQNANQESDRIVAEATAAAAERVTTARSRTAEITALGHDAPGLSRPMLINRLYYDRVGAVLSRSGSVEAVDGNGGSHVILPGPAAK